jgi:hypothetical protein
MYFNHANITYDMIVHIRYQGEAEGKPVLHLRAWCFLYVYWDPLGFPGSGRIQILGTSHVDIIMLASLSSVFGGLIKSCRIALFLWPRPQVVPAFQTPKAAEPFLVTGFHSLDIHPPFPAMVPETPNAPEKCEHLMLLPLSDSRHGIHPGKWCHT